ncbi:hypothetical protein [Pedobacter foliorum]|uniref:hypothetical protein n=1 Tax=Pedobacter foliorum TaxID=2739058 RepID=UPI0015636718|nr:hypothetical protein [Pedobacter foliorum]NRF37421.1 hypothetical protein [Pedobacter foliorum]
MKTIFFLLITFAFTNLFAQANDIYGKFTKSDGSSIKGSATYKGYEKQLIVTSYTGGSDNTATIEIEVPTETYIVDFRNLMTAPSNTTSLKRASTNAVKVTDNLSTQKIDLNKAALVVLTTAQPVIAQTEITITTRNPQTMSKPARKIILQDVKVLNCTDDAATGKSKIKLKASRIGWVYYSYDLKGNQTTSQSGWDTIAARTWDNF